MNRISPVKIKSNRKGTTIVEMAFVLPVFVIFLFALFEFGHALMVINVLTAAAKDAARYGAVEGITTEEVRDRVTARVGNAFSAGEATVLVKDASVYDEASPSPECNIASLPNIELADAEERQLYIVRVQVPYDDVALLPPFWVKGFTLHAESVIRHE